MVPERQVQIKVDRITVRIKYVCDFVFQNRGISYTLVMEDTGALDYTESGMASSFLYNENIVINPLFDQESQAFVFDEKIDYFGSIFYVLTRMEEYSHPDKDHHDRFTAQQSVLTKYGLLDLAICDRWAMKICVLAGIEVAKPNVSLAPTFDIDNTFAYRYKTGTRRTLSVLRDRLFRDRQRLQERKAVEKGSADPYDTFEYIRSIAKEHVTRLFWLVESKGKFDRNLDIHHPEHQSLIQELSKLIPIGIHPSYKSFQSVSGVRAEKELLEGILSNDIDSSRQHFLRFSLPESYRVLIKAGIRNDYTMGFADAVGFRAGTAHSFLWYDLLEEEITELRIHPFVYMDGTLNEYLKLTPERAKEKVHMLFKEVSICGGVFRFIWHNETIGEYKHWKGWRSVLDYTLSLYHE